MCDNSFRELSEDKVWDIPAGAVYQEEDLLKISNTIYVTSNKSGGIVQVITWTA